MEFKRVFGLVLFLIQLYNLAFVKVQQKNSQTIQTLIMD